jgi:long-chain acyl-CoA synthetase
VPADAVAQHAVSTGWNIAGFVSELAARGGAPAVIASSEQDVVTWDCATLAGSAIEFAAKLQERSLTRGTPIALWAPNSPQWIAAALGVLATGSVLVPVDDQADPAQFDAVLARSGAVLVLTTEPHRMACAEILARHATEVWQLDTAIAGEGFQVPPGAFTALTSPGADDPAVLLWTSGTTGSAKAFFLTHGNIAVNVEALRALAVVGPGDRALLPLPLHHAYPMVVGTLLTLTSGTAIILPGGPTGPLIMKAINDGQATAIVGVPRLYDALVAAIRSRVEGRGAILRLVWRGLVALAIAVQRSTGLRLGSVLFAPLRHTIAPRLRYLVSGGARLDQDTAEMLEALGWIALSGYGLAETASIFTGNSPEGRRAGSAGRSLSGQIRIAAPDAEGIGEIELKGPSVTAGYVDPAANAEAFTSDGWFRTGDLGYVDKDGFLFVTGRAKEILVLGGGKKVNPEDLEHIYGAAPEIREIAILEDRGALVALVHPDPAKLRARGTMNVRDGVRVVLGEKALDLPSYQRLSGFALTDQPLPMTRLGKYRRFLLPDLYARALSGGPQRAAHMLDAADLALLQDPTAASVWALLRERFPDHAIDLDVDPRLDLNLDSFAWMELGLALESRANVHLTEEDIAGVETLRDLVRLCVVRRAGAASGEEATALATDTERWLAPTTVLLTTAGFLLYGLNWLVMRLCFRLRISGLEHLPAGGAYVIAPNHNSDLDGFAVAASLSPSRVRHAYWAGDIVRLFFTRLTQTFCRAAHIFPVDERYPDAAVATAVRVLETGNAQIWFSEGWRSPDGNLQRFLPGIGQLLLRTGAPAVPAWIHGSFEALPRGRRIPRLHRITLTFGPAVAVEVLRKEGIGRTDEERIADALRSRVADLGRECGSAVVEQTA